MPFTGLGLDPALLRATRELGFTRPTPVQQDAIPPALAGRDVLACAMTGSGEDRRVPPPHHAALPGEAPRPDARHDPDAHARELAAQIDAHFADLAVHTPLTGAAVFGGVGMGPQEHAFRSGVDVIVATPGRLLDHFRHPYAKLEHLEVLDEADRMLDMGFLPDIRRVLRHVPARRQTLFFSATMPPPIVVLAREMLKAPVTGEPGAEGGAGGRDHARGLSRRAGAEEPAAPGAPRAERRAAGARLHADEAPRKPLAQFLDRHRVACERIHGNRSQAQRTQALAGFKAARFRVLGPLFRGLRRDDGRPRAGLASGGSRHTSRG